MCPEAFLGDGSDEKRTSRDGNGRHSGGFGERICRAFEERRTTPASGGSGVGRETYGHLQGEPAKLLSPMVADRLGAAGNPLPQAAQLWAESGAKEAISTAHHAKRSEPARGEERVGQSARARSTQSNLGRGHHLHRKVGRLALSSRNPGPVFKQSSGVEYLRLAGH